LCVRDGYRVLLAVGNVHVFAQGYNSYCRSYQ
jgi:hypothetical protein